MNRQALFFGNDCFGGKLWVVFTMQIHLKLIERMLCCGRLEFPTKRLFLFQEDARPNMGYATIVALADIGETRVEHPPYSPDLAPCDVLAFPTHKHELRRRKLSTDTEVNQTTAATLCRMSGNGLLQLSEK
jgi:hypothetical protein